MQENHRTTAALYNEMINSLQDNAFEPVDSEEGETQQVIRDKSVLIEPAEESTAIVHPSLALHSGQAQIIEQLHLQVRELLLRTNILYFLILNFRKIH